MTDEPEQPNQRPDGDAESIDQPAPEPEMRAARPADEVGPGAAELAARDASDVDLGRRGFFRAFGREALQAAANVVGTAGAIRRGTTAATTELLGLGIADPEAQAARLRSLGLDDSAPGDDDLPAGLLAGAPGEAPTGFRSPYRIEGDTIVILDQRALPDRIVETSCRSGAEVATQMRTLAVRGAPVLGQVAAYGLALTANIAKGNQPISRNSLLRATLNLLRRARPSVADVDHVLDRLEARLASLGPEARGAVIADALRAEADAIASTQMLANARLGRLGAAALPDVGERPLRIATLGSTGPLAGGMVGTALGVVFALLADGRECHVWIAETRPGLEGSRLAALELGRGGVRHTLVADAALGRLFADEPPDVCLVGAERICANGDTAAVTGTYPLALLAARHAVPLLVCAPTSTIDLSRPDGSELPREMRPELELTTVGSAAVAPVGTEAWNPAVDTTPAELIGGFVTEEGVLRAPFAESLAAAVAAAREGEHAVADHAGAHTEQAADEAAAKATAEPADAPSAGAAR